MGVLSKQYFELWIYLFQIITQYYEKDHDKFG